MVHIQYRRAWLGSPERRYMLCRPYFAKHDAKAADTLEAAKARLHDWERFIRSPEFVRLDKAQRHQREQELFAARDQVNKLESEAQYAPGPARQTAQRHREERTHPKTGLPLEIVEIANGRVRTLALSDAGTAYLAHDQGPATAVQERRYAVPTPYAARR